MLGSDLCWTFSNFRSDSCRYGARRVAAVSIIVLHADDPIHVYQLRRSADMGDKLKQGAFDTPMLS